jgi:hypothetical protein
MNADTSKRLTSKHRLPAAPGFTWELFCIALIFLSALAVSAAISITAVNDKPPGIAAVLTALVLWVLTLKVTPYLANKYRDRQRSVFETAEVVMKNDTRPPVLYLRSFKDDEKIARAITFYSIEQEMKVALFEIGPFIAMAEPDKPDPLDPGAARMRLPRDAWQQQVGEEMSKAALVIMRIGQSDGFWWELSEAPERVKPERLVLLLPAEDEQVYEKVRDRAREWLPCELPEFKREKWPFAGRGGLVYFEPDWTPHLQKFKTVWLRQTFWNLFTAVLKIGLRPVYEQLGITWKKPPVQPMQVLYILVLCLLAIFGLYHIYVMFMTVRAFING